MRRSFLLLLCASLLGCDAQLSTGTDTSNPHSSYSAQAPGSGGTGTSATRKNGVYVLGQIEAVDAHSLIVHGQEWPLTTASQLYLQDVAQLAVGQMVYLRANRQQQVVQLWLRPQLQGQIRWIDPERQAMNINGVVVRWNEYTQSLLPTWQEGDVVQVFADVLNHELHALLIQAAPRMAPARASIRLQSWVDQPDAGVPIFSLGATSYAMPLEIPLPSPQTCVHVELRPPLTTSDPVGVDAVVTALTQDQGFEFDSTVLAEGVLQLSKPAGWFDVGCYRVFTNEQTEWLNPHGRQLSSQPRVRVSGVLDLDAGLLQATRIEVL